VPPQSLSPAPEAAPAPQAPRKVHPAPSGEKSLYEAALALYYKGEYGKAREAFQSFLRSHPGSALAPNAIYWEGESLYSIGLYDQAIMIFMGVVNRYPKHDKAAASLLKIGHAYERMKDMDNARFYWQILLDDFPKSAPATLARNRLGIG
jgi:tol-pal system protein YbgF